MDRHEERGGFWAVSAEFARRFKRILEAPHQLFSSAGDRAHQWPAFERFPQGISHCDDAEARVVAFTHF